MTGKPSLLALKVFHSLDRWLLTETAAH